MRAAEIYYGDQFAGILNSTLPFTLKNFLEFTHIELPLLYKKGSWKRLCADAGVIPNFNEPDEKLITTCITRKLLQCNSFSYLSFILQLIENNFIIEKATAEQESMALMFHYDLWQDAGPKVGIDNIYTGIARLASNPTMVAELKAVVEYLLEQIDFIEKDIALDYPFPLKVHSRYNRDQILAAIQLHTFEKASSNREGVALNKDHNTEALFITLKKSEKEYSPTTLYNDYAINGYLFHWQSQNATCPESPKGISYINHQDIDKKILLFVREQNDDEYGFTMSYVFLGDANYIKSEGSKPMNIEWKLTEPMPAYIWKDSGKLAVG